MIENVKNELKNAFNEASQDELLNAEELGAVEGGDNNSCTNNGNCSEGCSCVDTGDKNP